MDPLCELSHHWCRRVQGRFLAERIPELARPAAKKLGRAQEFDHEPLITDIDHFGAAKFIHHGFGFCQCLVGRLQLTQAV